MKGIILPKRILVVAALLGWSFDLFFYGKAPGHIVTALCLIGRCSFGLSRPF